MSLLAPWFLLGLAAVALPLWLHRLQTQNPKRAPISSVLLLAPAELRLHVQKRLRFLLLLALRIALLILLALAFAQPLWQMAGGGGLLRSARQHLIFIDTSLSMGVEGRMAAAREAAGAIIDDLPAGDRAQLVAAGSTIELQAVAGSGPTSDKAALRRALVNIDAGVGRLEYAQAIGSIDSLAGEGNLPVVAHLVSDFQSSGLTPRFADLLPRGDISRPTELQLHPVAAPPAANWTIGSIRQSDTAIDVTVRGIGTSDTDLAVALRVNDAPRGELRQRVTAGGEAQFHFTDVALNAGDNRVVAEVRGGDRLPADDSHFTVLRGGGPEAVPLLTADTGGASVTYIAAALAVSGERYRAAAQPIDKFDFGTLERYRWLTIDDLGAIDAAKAAALRDYLQSGGALLAAVGNRAAALKSLPVSGHAVRGVTQRNADPLSIGSVDTTHPLLANLTGWQNLAVARMLKITPAADDRVLLSTADGEPLLLEQRVGNGRLLLLTTSLDNNWSDLPVQPVFVSLMAEASRVLAGEEAFSARQIAGATLQLAAAGAGASQVIDPDGNELLSLSATRNAPSVRLLRSGFYQVVTPTRESLVAVNVDPRESDLALMEADQLATWRQAAEAQVVAPAAASEQSQGRSEPLARWLLAILALIVVAESLGGNWLLRRNTKVLS